MLFYAQIRNKDAAHVIGMDEKQIALIKHRALKEIREHVVAAGTVSRSDAPMIDTPAWEASAQSASLLSDVWEQQRPTCPKRSTLGRFVLGTLEPGWQAYVDFHVNKLGCQFCRANLEDLRKQIVVNAERMQEVHPTAIELATLARLVFARVAERRAAESLVTLFNPREETKDYPKNETVLIAANDDMPFLFDSAMAASNSARVCSSVK
jgi:hypothetical protein